VARPPCRFVDVHVFASTTTESSDGGAHCTATALRRSLLERYHGYARVSADAPERLTGDGVLDVPQRAAVPTVKRITVFSKVTRMLIREIHGHGEHLKIVSGDIPRARAPHQQCRKLQTWVQ
jgi:hypothetical protein